jgi:hypothetical protein
MKTIKMQLRSTLPKTYGQIIEEYTVEVDDDYEERVDLKPAGYYSSEPMGMSGLPDFVLPQVLALIAIVFAIAAIVI